jgi:hypothetical protein
MAQVANAATEGEDQQSPTKANKSYLYPKSQIKDQSLNRTKLLEDNEDLKEFLDLEKVSCNGDVLNTSTVSQSGNKKLLSARVREEYEQAEKKIANESLFVPGEVAAEDESSPVLSSAKKKALGQINLQGLGLSRVKSATNLDIKSSSHLRERDGTSKEPKTRGSLTKGSNFASEKHLYNKTSESPEKTEELNTSLHGHTINNIKASRTRETSSKDKATRQAAAREKVKNLLAGRKQNAAQPNVNSKVVSRNQTPTKTNFSKQKTIDSPDKKMTGSGTFNLTSKMSAVPKHKDSPAPTEKPLPATQVARTKSPPRAPLPPQATSKPSVRPSLPAQSGLKRNESSKSINPQGGNATQGRLGSPPRKLPEVPKKKETPTVSAQNTAPPTSKNTKASKPPTPTTDKRHETPTLPSQLVSPLASPVNAIKSPPQSIQKTQTLIKSQSKPARLAPQEASSPPKITIPLPDSPQTPAQANEPRPQILPVLTMTETPKNPTPKEPAEQKSQAPVINSQDMQVLKTASMNLLTTENPKEVLLNDSFDDVRMCQPGGSSVSRNSSTHSIDQNNKDVGRQSLVDEKKAAEELRAVIMEHYNQRREAVVV